MLDPEVSLCCAKNEDYKMGELSVQHDVNSVDAVLKQEIEGSAVEECLTRDRRAAGSSLTCVTALCP